MISPRERTVHETACFCICVNANVCSVVTCVSVGIAVLINHSVQLTIFCIREPEQPAGHATSLSSYTCKIQS